MAPEGGRYGQDALGGEVAAGGGGAAHGGRRGKRPVARDACRREERPRGHPGVLSRPSWVQLAADAPWTWSTGDVRASVGGNREGDENRGIYVIYEISGTSR